MLDPDLVKPCGDFGVGVDKRNDFIEGDKKGEKKWLIFIILELSVFFVEI